MPESATTHPSFSELEALSRGKLDAPSAAALRSHLKTCEVCDEIASGLAIAGFLEREGAAPVAPMPGPTLSPEPSTQETKDEKGFTIPSLPPGLAQHAQYDVLRELGRGGMGIVYLAHNTVMDRPEVLKVMNQRLLDRPGAIDRFLREIRSAARLNHKNIVSAYNALRLGDLIVLTMEYIEGENFLEVLKSKGTLPVAHASYYIQQAANGLQHAHENGMVHRDIKPQNLILSKEGKKHRVKILDFGLAKASGEGKMDTGLTGTGVMLGTPDYVAPEQIDEASAADIRADIYSLGCTFYHLLIGSPPFKANNLYHILHAHQAAEAPAVSALRPEVPVKLGQIIAKMMAKQPSQRFQTPEAVAQALMPFVKPPTTGTDPASLPQAALTKSDRMRPLPPPLPKSIELIAADQPIVVIPSSARPATKAASSRGWLIGAILVALGLAILSALLASGVLKVRTKDGSTIVVENLPDDAEVIVDGEKMTIHKVGDGKPIEVSVAAGKRQLEVKKGGYKIESRELTLSEGERRPITLRYEPPAKNLPQPGQDVTNSIGMKFKWIAPGTFMMGSPENEDQRQRDETQHRVTLTKGFWMAETPVTRAEFDLFVKATSYKTDSERADGSYYYNGKDWELSRSHSWRSPGFEQTNDHPVVCISWNDCIALCAWLTKKDEVGRHRLPTEAEREYACRAETTTPFYFGNTISADAANYDGNSVYGNGSKGPAQEYDTCEDLRGK